jgi:hypothetical protein
MKGEITEVREKLVKGEKKVPYIGYGCGKFWIVSGKDFVEARSNAIDSFIEEFKEFLPPNVSRETVRWVVGIRKLGPEWMIDIKDAIKHINIIHNNKHRKTR